MRLIYVSGPYTGRVDANTTAAVEAGRLLREHGFVALVPHIAIVPMEAPDSPRGYAQAMRECVALMLRCDAVLMVAGWEKSRGARIERWIACRSGLPVFETLETLIGGKQ
ncbi:MAG: DUF4406 domain-containing protein [Acidobacteria bacterium]|nr:DUF4406 domain-containing protein [Acidobacteriota bacterium]